MKRFLATLAGALCTILTVSAQSPLPVVAVHDSEYTRALLTMNASGGTPTGSGTTGKQWWPTNWNYFTMPESMKEMLRSDGTAFKSIGDSNIIAGDLLVNGQPRYPIVISLASEAIRNEEIAQFTNYVAAGGFLFVGSSSFTRNTNGTTRGDFAIANEMGISCVNPNLSNWGQNSYFEKENAHRLVNHIPSGGLYWDMPASAEENSWGISPSHAYQASHPVWQVQANGATILAYGDTYPLITVRPYGKGYFIYHAGMQPIIGHGGWASGMYSYGVFREAIEWAFESNQRPVPKLSPWPFQYDAAVIFRHDLENYQDLISTVENSAQVEYTYGAKGDYYFCTGTLREDIANKNAAIGGLRRAVTNYGATIGPHNGGLKNPRNGSLTHADYDYWHWGPDEALDVTPSGYSSGKAYAFTSLSNAFLDVEGWLSGISTGPRNWCVPYFNGTRDDSYDIQVALNVKVTGEQKIGPFPHWTVSNKSNKNYPLLNIPVNDWYVGNFVAQSMGEHNQNTLHDAVDYYYAMGGLVNIYSHALSDYGLPLEYVTYTMNTNLHPRLWSANSVGIYQWWLQRSNVVLTTSYATNGPICTATIGVSGSANTNTAVEIVIPGPSYSGLQVLANGAVANANSYRTNGQIVRVRVGTTVTNVIISYVPCVQGPFINFFAQNFDSVSTPGLPSGWTTSATGSQSAWVTQNTVRDTVPNAAYASEASNFGVSDLTSPSIALPAGDNRLAFKHDYDMEPGWDGGVLEIKIGGGAFTDIVTAGGTFVSGGLTHTLSSSSQNPLGGRQAWSGDSVGFVTTIIDLPASAAGQNVQFKWRCATDNSTAGNGWRVDTITISNRTYICDGGGYTNTAPTLPAQSNKTISETSSLTVTNMATDVDNDLLTYTLLVAPTGATISSQGIINWTPSEGDGGTVKTFTTRVSDSGVPSLSATNSFTVTVNEVNSAPDLPAQSNRTIPEGTTLIVTNTASDLDVPSNALTYSLLAAPAGASISGSGVINWTPTEAQGPSTNVFTTRVVDNGSPNLSDTNTFTVIVTEVNSAPVLPAQSNRIIPGFGILTVTNTATDPDVPVNSLTYSLTAAPLGATISANGVINWIAPGFSSTNLFRTVVTDNGTPVLGATNTFTVIVAGSPSPQVVLDSAALTGEGCVPNNNAIDNGESVTVNFALENIGTADTTNLVVTLLQTNGVMAPSGPQNYGALVAGGAVVNRSFSFTAAGFCGSNITATLQLQDGATDFGTITVSFPLGAIGTVVTQNFDSVTFPALPAGWTAQSSGANAVNWYTTNTFAEGINAVFARDIGNVTTNFLFSQTVNLPPTDGSYSNQLTFRHRYALEADVSDTTKGYDGGALEIKIGAGPWLDIEVSGGSFVLGGYDRTIDPGFGSYLGGRDAWSGTNGGYITSLVDLPAASAGQAVQFRWVCATDNGTDGGGWRVDSIGVLGRVCCVNVAPTLPSQNTRTNAEGNLLTVINTVTDVGQPATGVNYILTVTNINTGLVVPGPNINGSGVITWTPTEAQGPSTNLFTTTAINSSVPSLTAVNTFLVIVPEVNSAPTLPLIGQQTIAEGSLLSVNDAATDTDLPANPLAYSLVNPPAGASINSSGLITWTPTEAQGPSTNTIVAVVNDGTVSVTNSFTVVVTEVNQAPVLPVIGQQTVAESSLLSVNDAATDADLPANVLTYSLVNPPAGVSISGSGLITWTPTEAQGPSTNTILAVVNDGTVSVTNSFTVIVTEVNQAPVLPVINQQTVVEGSLLSVNNAATDSDLPANTLTYSLVNPPAGVSINAGGLITWTPSEAQGPSTNTITTVVSDGSASATNSFTVIVTEVNNAPTLPVLGDQAIPELSTLVVTNTATDTDLPANTLSYSLVNPPANATIDAQGVITFTPSEAQGPSTNIITTIVSDGTASATNSFIVIVTEVNSAPAVPTIEAQMIAEGSLLAVNSAATDADLPANTLTYSLVNPPAGASINSSGLITWTPTEAQGPSTNTIVAVINDGTVSVTNSFTVIVTEVNQAPVLPVINDQTISEGSLLNINNAATDADLPANVLTYSLVNPPAGASINSSGLITWMPTEAQGPSTNVIVAVVNDGTVSITNSVTVIVTEVNSAPVFPTIEPQTVAEGSLLSVNNAASDSDVPSNTLTYSLVNSPAGANINSSGLITWTPTEAQGPSTNTIVVVVNDGTVSVTNSFNVIVTEANSAPVFPAIEPQTVAEGSLLSVNDVATDSDIPVNTLIYSLVNPPAGASISSTGLITWTPSEAQGPSTNTIVAVVNDGSVSVTNSFVVVVNEVNQAPVLPVIVDQTIPEGSLLSVNDAATDSDVPANTLTYSLVNPPAGASVNSSGLITWTPTEAQGPSTNMIVAVVNDGTVSVTNSFTVVVTEVNDAPVLPVITAKIMDELTVLTVTNTATDADIPAGTLSYSLINPPAHASIDQNGVITFAPDETQGPSTNVLVTVVSDGIANATNSFTVIVNEVNSAPILANQTNRVVRNHRLMTVANAASDADLPLCQLSYVLVDAPLNASISDSGEITWTPNEGHCPKTNFFTTVVTDSGGLSATNTFAVVVTEPPQPVIQSITVANGMAMITWSSASGETYRLQYKDTLDASAWQDLQPDVPATGETSSGTDSTGASPQRFYRVLVLP